MEMKKLDYLVIYHNNKSIYTDSKSQIPISVILREEADAEEKMKSINFLIKQKTGIDDFTILGIFKL